MKILKPGAGTERPTGDDCLIVIFTGWKRDGSVFSTSGIHGEAATQCLQRMIPGIAEPLKLMTAGEKRRVWVPANLGFPPARHAHHRPAGDLTFDLELVRILRAPAAPVDLRTPPGDAIRLPSGVAMEVLQEGSGNNHPVPGSLVKVNYSGWTADGELLESTVMSGHPAVFPLGTVTVGWRDALQQMVPGEKIRVWIPAALANRTRKTSQNKKVPSGNMVYEFELLSIE